MKPAPAVVVMGVCGAGKTAVGRALAAVLGVPFVDGDDLHPPANVARMAAGTALTDDDRRGWLDAVAARLAAAAPGGGVVLACSALKRDYRDRLRRAAPATRFVFLHGEPALIAERLAARRGHYMPASLLRSQLDTLEPPSADEDALTLDVDAPVEAIALAAAARLEVAPA